MYRSHAGDIGPVSLVARHRQKLDLSLLLHWLTWERNCVWTHGSVGRYAGDCVESPFSQEQWDPFKSVDNSQKVAMCWPREIRMIWDHTRTKCGIRMVRWSGFPLQNVHQFESPLLSDMSIACLWQLQHPYLLRRVVNQDLIEGFLPKQEYTSTYLQTIN
jgi:hypothetical protein